MAAQKHLQKWLLSYAILATGIVIQGLALQKRRSTPLLKDQRDFMPAFSEPPPLMSASEADMLVVTFLRTLTGTSLLHLSESGKLPGRHP